MLRRLSATALATVLVATPSGVASAQAATASAPVPALRVVPDTRAELRELRPAVWAAELVEEKPEEKPAPGPAPVEPEPAPDPAPAPPPPPAAVSPVAGAADISDYYGLREAPAPGASTFHQGLDFAAPAGASVVAAAAGTVSHVVPVDAGACGVEVIIQHEERVGSVSTRYCHLLDGSATVAVGQAVAAGQPIAAVGSTGVSTGPHLHFEVIAPDGNKHDPLGWLHQHAH
ncbi:M23 family metallopeptidase [Leifsonia sp. NPDC077715]|uniref:M23 family metallopeptidase n=1 Tax=Leifsonia sp. NPDC077715 TaxID=3155539 RepID=UPI00341BAF31